MNRRDYSRKAEQAKRVPLGKILEGQTFLTLKNTRQDVKQIPVEAWDAWANSLCEEIGGVNREVWDVFARQRFINYLLADEVLDMQIEADGTILLAETEEKTSAAEGEMAVKPSAGNMPELAQEGA